MKSQETPPPSHYLQATGCMLLSTISFAVMSAVIKLLQSFPLPQLMFFRSAIALGAIVTYLILNRRVHRLQTRRPGTHFLRGLFGVTSMAACFYAVTTIPLATASALIHTKSLFVLPFAAFFLGETFYLRRLAIAAVGFLGVGVMLNPTSPEINPGTITALGAAMLVALAVLCIRSLGKTETTEAVVFYFMLLATLTSGCASLFWWKPVHSPDQFLLLVSIGLTGVLGQIFLVQAYKYAEVSFVAQLDYAQVLWSTLIGFLFWNEVPTLWLIAGATIVVASQIALQRHAFGIKTKIILNTDQTIA